MSTDKIPENHEPAPLLGLGLSEGLGGWLLNTEMVMSPLELQILLHYRCCARDFRNGDFTAPAVREAIDWFKGDAELLERDGAQGAERCYRLSERGTVFVEVLCNTKLPEKKWVPA